MVAFIVEMIGEKGLIALLGSLIFFFCFKYSLNIFQLIENRTLNIRNYLLEKLKLLFIEVRPEVITYSILALSLGLGGLAFFIFILLGKWVLGLIVSVIFGYIGFKLPKPCIDFFVSKRIKKYSSQMADGLTLLASGIRAGLSVPQALSIVVDEMPNPISQEFNQILQQNRVGVPLEECFENLSKRIPTEDNDMFVTSVNTLRETGGNLSEVFDTIVGVIKDRIRLKQKIDTQIAQSFFQGVTIFCMPFLIGGVQALSDPASYREIFTNKIGLILILLALILDIIGGILILKIVKIKV